MDGWIKLHRSILKHWIFANADYFRAWITILLTVNHEEAKILIHGELIICGRGQSLLSLNNWAKLFGRKWTVQKVRTFFELLKNDSMINTEGLRKTTRLTVCNYDNYQDMQQTNNTQKTRKQQTDNTQTTTNNKNKKDIDKSISTWRDDFNVYIAEASKEFSKLANDEKFLSEQQLFYPEVHLKKTMQKMWTNYWGTQAGWKKKKSSKTNNIDWKGTIVYGFSQSINKVYYTKHELAEIERR